MKLTFCGAAGTTTGSQHLVEINNQKILLDCGLFQGRRQDAYEKNRSFRFNPSELNAVVLSHAHIDHSGNLPNLVKQGYTGSIYSTFATRDLCQLMLADSAHVQAADIKFVNKKLAIKNLPPVEPIYSMQEAEVCLRQFVTAGYNRPMHIADGVTLTFIDAGHILGSAQVILDLHEFETGRKSRFLFSGDVGRGKNKILRNPEFAKDVDYMIMESTYGGVTHEVESSVNEKLQEIINKALETKGKILIPAFAVERTQQIIFALHQLAEAGALPHIPIYVDSPLAVSATEVFRLHPECFNDDIYKFLYDKRNPFGFDQLRFIREMSQSKELNDKQEPCIIIASSGMCEAGRILHHLRNNISNPSTTVLFVGYCAEQTLGWKIRHGEKKVNIFGEPFEVKASIRDMDNFSGHADHNELMNYFNQTEGSKKKIWLVHGEPHRTEALRSAIVEEHPKLDVSIAQHAQVVNF